MSFAKAINTKYLGNPESMALYIRNYVINNLIELTRAIGVHFIDSMEFYTNALDMRTDLENFLASLPSNLSEDHIREFQSIITNKGEVIEQYWIYDHTYLVPQDVVIVDWNGLDDYTREDWQRYWYNRWSTSMVTTTTVMIMIATMTISMKTNLIL